MVEGAPVSQQGRDISAPAERKTYPPLTYIVTTPGEPFSVVPILDPERIKALVPGCSDYKEKVGVPVEFVLFEVTDIEVHGAIVFIEVRTALDDIDKKAHTVSAYPAGVVRNYAIYVGMGSPKEEDIKRIQFSLAWKDNVYGLNAEYEEVENDEGETVYDTVYETAYEDSYTAWKSKDGQKINVAFPDWALPEIQYKVDLEALPDPQS